MLCRSLLQNTSENGSRYNEESAGCREKQCRIGAVGTTQLLWKSDEQRTGATGVDAELLSAMLRSKSARSCTRRFGLNRALAGNRSAPAVRISISLEFWDNQINYIYHDLNYQFTATLYNYAPCPDLNCSCIGCGDGGIKTFSLVALRKYYSVVVSVCHSVRLSEQSHVPMLNWRRVRST